MRRSSVDKLYDLLDSGADIPTLTSAGNRVLKNASQYLYDNYTETREIKEPEAATPKAARLKNKIRVIEPPIPKDEQRWANASSFEAYYALVILRSSHSYVYFKDKKMVWSKPNAAIDSWEEEKTTYRTPSFEVK